MDVATIFFPSIKSNSLCKVPGTQPGVNVSYYVMHKPHLSNDRLFPHEWWSVEWARTWQGKKRWNLRTHTYPACFFPVTDTSWSRSFLSLVEVVYRRPLLRQQFLLDLSIWLGKHDQDYCLFVLICVKKPFGHTYHQKQVYISVLIIHFFLRRRNMADGCE